MLGYVLQESNAINVHAVKAEGDFLVSIKYKIRDILYYDSFQMLDPVEDWFALQMWHTQCIYVLINTKIYSHNWDIV